MFLADQPSILFFNTLKNKHVEEKKYIEASNNKLNTRLTELPSH